MKRFLLRDIFMNKIHKPDTGIFTKIVSIQVCLQVLACILKMILGSISAFPHCVCAPRRMRYLKAFPRFLTSQGFTSRCFHTRPQKEEGQLKAFPGCGHSHSSAPCHHTYLQVYGTLESLTRVLRFKGILSTVISHVFLKGAATSEGLSPACFFICARRDEENLYAFPHSLHSTCPPSVCLLTCTRRA